ncbi:MAG: transposase [Burkholderia sp.]
MLPKAARGPHQPATQFLHLIGKLYATEVRERYSRMVLGKTKALLDEHLETTLPGGKLGQTLGYLGNQLSRYIENETWPICNNARENSIRPFVVGKKN